MNKKAQIAETLMSNVIYLILLAIFVVGMFAFIWQQSNNAAVWEEYYTKEITKIIDLAKPGDKVTLDVQKATEIALKNNVASLKSDVFNFNNANNEVCIKLSQGRASCYKYFNDVDVIDRDVQLGIPENVLNFKVVKKLRS